MPKLGKRFSNPPDTLYVIEVGPAGPTTFKPIQFNFDEEEQAWFCNPTAYPNHVVYSVDKPGLNTMENGHVVLATPDRDEAVIFSRAWRVAFDSLKSRFDGTNGNTLIRAIKVPRRGRK